MDMATDENIEEFIDEATWMNKMAEVKKVIVQHAVSGGIFVHSGSLNGRSGVKDKTFRLAAALLLRLLVIISLLLTSGLYYIIVVPWPSEDPQDVRSLSAASGMQEAHSS